MSEQGRQPTEEEIRAFEEQLKRVRVEDVLIQTIVSLINMGGGKAGLAPGSEDERDLGQVHQAIEAVRALLPLVEGELGPDAGPIRDALSQLQLAYARFGGAAAAGEGAGAAGGAEKPAGDPSPASQQPEQPAGPGPAQSSGRLWVPGR